MEATPNHMKNIKLASFTSENDTNCYKAIVSYVDRLDSDGVLRPKNLADIYRILEDSK